MPEAWCVDDGHACSPMILYGWGVCKACRKKEKLDFAFLNTEVHSAGVRSYIRDYIRTELKPKKKGAA